MVKFTLFFENGEWRNLLFFDLSTPKQQTTTLQQYLIEYQNNRHIELLRVRHHFEDLERILHAIDVGRLEAVHVELQRRSRRQTPKTSHHFTQYSTVQEEVANSR